MSDDDCDRIDDLRRRFEEHAELDREELGRINRKLDKLGASMARTSGMLEVLTGELGHRREIQRIETQTEATGRVQLETTRTTWRYKALIAIASAAFGVLGAYVASLAS